MKYELDEGAGGGCRLGAIILGADYTLEYEARQVLGTRAISMLHARIPSILNITPDTLRTMADSMTHTADLLPQGMNAIAYCCTSGATVIGPDKVANLVQAAHPDVPVTDPMTAVIAALGSLKASKIALVTPYVASVTGPMRDYLATHGIETLSEVSFGEGDDPTVARIAEASTLKAMLEAGRAEGVQAVFASCTNLRSFGVIEQAEQMLDVPVISSNSALMWHLLKLAGQDAKGWGPGRLYQDS